MGTRVVKMCVVTTLPEPALVLRASSARRLAAELVVPSSGRAPVTTHELEPVEAMTAGAEA